MRQFGELVGELSSPRGSNPLPSAIESYCMDAAKALNIVIGLLGIVAATVALNVVLGMAAAKERYLRMKYGEGKIDDPG